MSETVDPIRLGTDRQLFIDDFITEEILGVTRVLNQPTKYAGNPIMIPIHPWEGRVTLYGTVWYNQEREEFEMWYQGYGAGGVPALSFDHSTSPWADFDATSLVYTFCYATSKDGVFWDRPNLGLVEYAGSKDNNIVLFDAAFANVIDAREENPDRLYKALFFESRDPEGTPNMGDGASVAFSPDGLRWTKFESNPVLTRTSDTHTLLGWDDTHGKYVAYIRPPVRNPKIGRAGTKVRVIGRSVSDDFVNWTESEVVLAPDDEDSPGTQFYGMPVFKYEGLYLGQLYVYHAPPEEPHIAFSGPVDVQLAASRDGISWERVDDRKPFIPNGPAGSIDHGEIFTARAPVVVGDELWFYYSGSPSEHGITGRSGPICLAKLRLDGFVSVDAGDEGGILITKPFHCEGGRLSINADARGGTVSAVILDDAGVQVAGYGRIDCAVFDSDSVHHKVTWRENVLLEPLRGRVIRLKFYLRNAHLYSFAVR